MRKRIVLFILFFCCSLVGCSSEDNISQTDNAADAESKIEKTEIENVNSNGLTGFRGGIVSYSPTVDLEQYSDIVELILSDAESINVNFVFTADYTLKDLKLYTLAFADIDTIKFTIEDTVYESPAFGVNSALHISANFLELYPNLAVSYIDETGNQVYYYIQISMKNGEIILRKAEGDLIL